MDQLTDLFAHNYIDASKRVRRLMRKEVLDFFVEEGEGSLFRAEILMWKALDDLEEIEAYEECAIIKDILNSIGPE